MSVHVNLKLQRKSNKKTQTYFLKEVRQQKIKIIKKTVKTTK